MNTLRVYLNRLGYSTDKGWYTPAEAAKAAGISESTLKRWRLTGMCDPSKRVRTPAGLTIHLYDLKGIETLKSFAKSTKPGPKPSAKKAKK